MFSWFTGAVVVYFFTIFEDDGETKLGSTLYIISEERDDFTTEKGVVGKKCLFGLFLLNFLGACFGRTRKRVEESMSGCVLNRLCGVGCVSAD